MSRLRVAIVGGSGYTGGELIRLLLFHPHVELTQIASGSRAGHYVHSVHPNLRKVTALRFCHPNDLTTCDIVFLCLPHGASAGEIERYQALAPRVIDLSADFRLRSPELYERWYGAAHRAPELLNQAIYGLPELHRRELAEANLVSGTGCMATAAILGLAPLYRAGLVNRAIPLVVEAKVGSSAAGATPGASSHHPERSGAVRSFQPTGHRHSAELIQELGELSGGEIAQPVAFSATAIELVRGILITAHVFVNEPLEERRLWRVYREAYQQEPFVRIVKERNGVYRYPEPKILVGSNYCDVGFEYDAEQQRVVVMAALDNLMKGAAGNAVQALNCMFGWDEVTGLSFPGLHPV
ncbi:N-acetyl-gamma-glutamyl-phosphate reductase [Ktedonosporobacter rubrisoli]|uniref:Putative [LysW]-L-2-aminoadipate 6-phosphate reductase n=1 Tax=Ktedonosporobacter rubrisoli TaxID=2509675 RepID=A0A4P6K0L9_KTERU|nr:N-acetyl-gamma-glutamyl-phosphate reductase [Ktedonosporobacter rubrisoli]QBD81599.1 N-acetyl-gamma-glutamyl-phosphate reductase [Ktedonosporobacter rubrisoli]